MDKKDIISLMEAYSDVILDKEIEVSPDEPMDGIEISDEIDTNDDLESRDDIDISDEADMDTLKDFEEEKNKMVEAHLHTIRSHAHEIHGCLERGVLIEPWMEEKIAIANDYIVHVANAIIYKK
jgi:hypothetical protein